MCKGEVIMHNGSSVFERNFHIDLRDVDFKKELKLSTLFGYFQDIANMAAYELGAGIDNLSENFSVAWVLAKIRVEIIRIPVLGEEITIKTWPLPPKRVEFQRDFLVLDQDGKVIIRGISTWVIIDINDRKLKRADTIGLNYPEEITERAIDVKLGKLQDFGNIELAYKKVIGYSDIDLNGHLNNSKYVDYIMDCFPIEKHSNHQVTSIEVHFVNEALPGETIAMFFDSSESMSKIVYIEGKNDSSDKVIFRSQLSIQEEKNR